MRFASKFMALACVLVVGLAFVSQANAQLVGLWEFEDAGNLTAATIGSDLVLTGSDAAVAGSGGLDTGASALDLFSIDVNQLPNIVPTGGGFYTVTNPIGANGGGARTNSFTLLMDIQFPGGVTGFTALAEFDSDVNAGSDSDYFLDEDGANDRIGVGNQGYVDTVGNLGTVWHRIVLSVENGVKRTTYIDGVDLGDHDLGSIDGRWSLDGDFEVFLDGDLGEELLTYVSNLALFGSALNANQVANLGGVGTQVIPEPSSMALIVLFGLGLSVTTRRKR